MSELCRWMVELARKNWQSVNGGQPTPTFMNMSQDVFLNICEWLSVRDILTLRMTNKWIAHITLQSTIWSSVLRRLMVPLPILPATSRYRFGEISPKTYEWLMTRALYLEQNWRRQNPVACHSRFQAFGRTIVMKMLPGGKYLVIVSKNMNAEKYALVVWDLDHAGRRVALTGETSNTPFLKLEVKYAVVKGYMSIAIAYAKPAINKEDGLSTQVRVVCIPIVILEELAMHQPDSELFRSFAETLELPFRLVHESWTCCDVGQLALGDFDGELVLLVVHRPRALVFHYIERGQRGNLLLGAIRPYETLRHSIWSVKLLPGQNSVLVSRVLVEVGVPLDSTLFALDMFLLPGPGSTYKNPSVMGRQLISGLHVDGFHFSDLETSWYASLRDPKGLLRTIQNKEPPPISIFVTTKEPRGFVQCLMRPIALPNEHVKLPNGRGLIRRHVYELPALKVERHVWGDEYARPVILAGAYRSIIWMRPHVKPALQEEGPANAHGVEILRFCTYATRAEGYEKFATPRTTGNLCTEDGPEGEAMEVEEEDLSLSVALEEDLGLRKRSLRIPSIPNLVAWNMMDGTTAVAFDESVGRMCVATTEDTDIHVLDFGGEKWELAVVQP